MGASSTEALTAEYVADGHGRRTQERHDANGVGVGARHSCASWRKTAKREAASVSFGRAATIDVSLSYQCNIKVLKCEVGMKTPISQWY